MTVDEKNFLMLKGYLSGQEMIILKLNKFLSFCLISLGIVLVSGCHKINDLNKKNETNFQDSSLILPYEEEKEGEIISPSSD